MCNVTLQIVMIALKHLKIKQILASNDLIDQMIW